MPPSLLQRFEFRPSRYLAISLVAMTGLGLVALLLAWPMWAIAVASALLLLNLWHCLRQHVWLLRSQSCTGLSVDSAGSTLLQRDGKQIPCEISPDSLVTPWLVVVNLTAQDRRTRSFVILPDSMHKDAFRQLRVWMKWGLSGGEVVGRREHGRHG